MSAEWQAYKAVVADLEALLVLSPRMTQEDRQKRLLHVLARFELACLDLPDVTPDDVDGDSPHTYATRRETIALAFPEFGCYHHIRPSSVSETETANVGDAVDDLADILSDIDQALWAEAEQGQNNAIWEAKFSYEHHAGAHLADLRSYLYRMRFFGH